MLSLENVNKRWGEFAHQDITLDVPKGEFFVLLGPSGAGKTLLLELIAGFHRPGSGVIRIAGRDVTRLPPEKRNVGFVYQDQMLFPHRTVRQNIAYGLRAHGVRRPERRKRIDDLADLLRLAGLLDRSVTSLSVGQKQRVSLARALAIRPHLLLLDEPFAALDPPLKLRLCDELRRLHEQTGVTIFHVTHDRAEAMGLAQRIGVIRDGRLRQVGADLAVFEKPNSAFVAYFTGGHNVYEGEASPDGDVTRFRSGDLEFVAATPVEGLVAGPCRAMVRPEHIIIALEPIHTSARNQIELRIESIVRGGAVYEITGRRGRAAMTCVVTPHSAEDLGLAAGVRVYYAFKASSVHLFDEDPKGETLDDDLA